ncbi:fungal-specific transcription factor domain-containing protein [Aspergillus unguis]
MATVITIQSPSTAGLQASPSDRHLLRPLLQNNHTQPPQPQQSSPTAPIGTLPSLSAQVRDGPSCDACLRRKSRCAMNEMVNKCYSCDFHRQDCTFTLSSPTTTPNTTRPSTADLPSKKRKLDDILISDAESPKRLSTISKADRARSPLSEHPRLNTVAYWHQTTQHIGLTTELEPALLAYLPVDQNDESFVAASRVRKLGDDGTFMRVFNTMAHADPQYATLDAIESLVAPYGSTLVEKFFEHIHPTFPILMEDVFRQSYKTRNGISPLLLSAVYVLALKFVDISPASQSARRPDAARLESTALKLLTESLPYASMSTIQAGLLLMQKSTLATAPLNAQLVTAGFELGLHQDCSDWRMETWEKGLRKRLAWALYIQDKWSAMVHGRPSHIVSSNWTVQDLVEDDFTDAFATTSSSQHEDAPVGHGPLFFCYMVALTTILSDILDRFYTLQSIQEFKAAGGSRTRLILERAKPAQIRLKDWFARLPASLKLDSTTDLFDNITEENARNGALHLSYFATEITLHRCIVRSLSPNTTDAYLSHICRSAAKTRLISAMDFVNRLRSPHLRSFWPAASRTHFALIGSFGTLLRVTAPTKEEAEFYRLRLCEYRWTLSVSRKDAEFLDFALESLDNATDLDQHVPVKPGIDELMTSEAKPFTAQPRTVHESVLDMDQQQGGPGSSVISGLASPATSISEESIHDVVGV